MTGKTILRVVGSPIWGVFLLFVGGVFLLQTLNIFPWGLWGTLWRFWPVLIIIIGLRVLFRHRSVWLVSLLTFIILGACLGIAIWQSEPFSPTEVTTTHSETFGSMECA